MKQNRDNEGGSHKGGTGADSISKLQSFSIMQMHTM